MKNQILVILLFLMLSCQKKNENTTTGNPFVSLAMTSSSANATVAQFKKTIWDLVIPKSYAFPPPATLLDSAGNTIVIQNIWVNFGQIEFKADEVASGSEVDGDDIEFNSTYAIDLLSNTPQAFASGQINLNGLRRIKVKLTKTLSLPSGAPSGFLGKSIYISGTVNGHSFSYSTQDESVVEIAGPQLVTAVENKTILLELQTANLIKKMNLSAITATTNIDDSNRVSFANPCSQIDNSSTDLFNCFYKGFEKESNIGRDDDGNFQLDPNEDKVK